MASKTPTTWIVVVSVLSVVVVVLVAIVIWLSLQSCNPKINLPRVNGATTTENPCSIPLTFVENIDFVEDLPYDKNKNVEFGKGLCLDKTGQTKVIGSPFYQVDQEQIESEIQGMITMIDERFQKRVFIYPSVNLGERALQVGTNVCISWNGLFFVASGIYVEKDGTKNKALWISSRDDGKNNWNEFAFLRKGLAQDLGTTFTDAFNSLNTSCDSNCLFIASGNPDAASLVIYKRNYPDYQDMDEVFSKHAYSKTTKFGYAVSINAFGNIVVCSELENDLCQVFYRKNNKWDYLMTIAADYTTVDPLFGSSCCIDADGIHIAVGAPGEGVVYIFENTSAYGDQPTYLKTQKIASNFARGGASNFGKSASYELSSLLNPTTENSFGSSLAVSYDGKTFLTSSYSTSPEKVYSYAS